MRVVRFISGEKRGERCEDRRVPFSPFSALSSSVKESRLLSSFRNAIATVINGPSLMIFKRTDRFVSFTVTPADVVRRPMVAAMNI